MLFTTFTMATLAMVSFVAVGTSAGQSEAGRSPAHVPPGWKLPKTPWGHPDLQGLWTNGTITPMERPREFADKEFLNDDEIAQLEQRVATARNADRRDGSNQDDLNRAYNDFWWDWGSKVVPTKRTSLVIDPPTGRIPAIKPEARAAVEARRRRGMFGGGLFAGVTPEAPEDFSLLERCITRGLPEAMMPYAYNNNYEIVQTPDYVGIVIEMIHDMRIIPLKSRPALPPSIRRWLGESRGRWEGNTLVVETTNFTDQTNFRGTSENMRLTERFTRVSPGMIDYRFTIDDPATFTRTWTVALPLTSTQGPIFEYACHEGNVALPSMLQIARAGEKNPPPSTPRP